jgi:5'(3')-deoxyribonucleotidase
MISNLKLLIVFNQKGKLSMTKYILTDIDDTIVSFNSRYIHFLEDEGHIELCPNTHDVLDVSKDLLTDAETIINQFQETNFFSDLKPFKCAHTVLPVMKEHGYVVVGISAAQNTYMSLRNRKINMQRYFPDVFDDIIHVNHKNNKRQYLERFPESIWVEDLYENAVVGAECGHRSYYLLNGSTPIYRTDSVIQVENWFEICEKELGFLP